MILIQPVLILLLLLGAVFFFRFVGNQILGRFFVVLLGLIVLFFLVFPGTTQYVAEFFGVGRGADMLFYFTDAFLFVLIGVLYAKFKSQKEITTRLIRELAIHTARPSSAAYKPEAKGNNNEST